jgi:hypothetical protein
MFKETSILPIRDKYRESEKEREREREREIESS